MGYEFALPFVFTPYFADSYGGKETTHKSLLKDVCYKLIIFFIFALREYSQYTA